MGAFCDLTKEELMRVYETEKNRLEQFRLQELSINMARGRPCAEQLDLSDDLLDLNRDRLGIYSEDGMDCRNYGGLLGLSEVRRLFGEIMDFPAQNVIACGSSSLQLMFDYIAQCMTHGTGGFRPWYLNDNRKFIAIVPGYDRHFAIAEYFGLRMINVPMTAAGPDMDAVEELVKDPDVKGMFCVPKYSNPDGITYSDETVERLARLAPAAEDFRVIWDEAYIVHDLYEPGDVLKSIYAEAKKYGHQDHFVAFASTSKITFAGAGLAAIAASDRNFREIEARMTRQIISFDKVNQLRHAYLYKNLDDIKRQMRRHAAILRPKFEAVRDILHEELDGTDIADWTDPNGGYFISFSVKTGSARQVGRICKDCGLILTGVGATYPYGNDPFDANIRIAPSCPTAEELKTAARILCAATRLSAAAKLLGVTEAWK
ncbi:MAG: aminotransferase class I/II-fold pyridoxal phosphate-dependent enzyme [Clostridia bacterium]|nr:aminotransferase class I/II-fold pyridoxal phosphate-dependent enzyme [Clostridia bacterium]